MVLTVFLAVIVCQLGICAGTVMDSSASRGVLDFDADWRFHLGDIKGAERSGLEDKSWRRLDLPHDWSAESDFSPTNASGTGFLPGGTGWYRKHFTLPDTARGDHFSIRFDGVSRDSDVWINGVHLGHRPNGYSTFEYDLTPHLKFGGAENVIAVGAERENVADSRWYPGTGIYRHVRLARKSPVHVEPWGVQITTPRITDDSADVVTTSIVTNGSGKNVSLTILSRVMDADGAMRTEISSTTELRSGESKTLVDWQKLPQPRRWSLEQPMLYRLVTQLKDGNQIVDEVTNTFGIRTIYFDAAKGFFLNGTNTLIKGLCLHHDAGTVGAAVPEAMWERRLRAIKAMGANAVRTSHNPQAPEFYDLCDQLGLLVMDEAFDEWEIGKRKWVAGRNEGHADRFGYSSAFNEWGERDLADMVRQHRNHPSIILWSIGNEIDYPTDPYVHAESRNDPDFAKFTRLGHPPAAQLTAIAPKLIAAVKRFDTTRPVTMALANVPAANGTGLADMLDVAGYNYQEEQFAPDKTNFPHRAIIGSENGRAPENWLMIKHRGDIAGLFLWCGIDFLGEAGLWPNHGSMAGVFDTSGFLKPSAFQFEALWKTEPVLRLVVGTTNQNNRRGRQRFAPSWTWRVDDGEPMRVTAFCNGDEAELFLNDKSQGIIRVGEDCRASWDAPYARGELRAVSRRAGTEVARDVLRTAGRAIKIVAEEDSPELTRDSGVRQLVLRVVDEHGVTVPDFNSPITISLTGGGKILGLDNGNLFDPTPLRSHTRTPRDGKLLAIVRADTGEVVFEAAADGLIPARITISK